MPASVANLPVQVVIDPDSMRAWLVCPVATDLLILNAQNISAVLEASEIASDDAVVARIHEFVKLAHARKAAARKFLIAEGIAPVDARDGTFLWQEDPRRPPPPATAGDCEQRLWCSLHVTPSGSVIGRINPRVDGVAGTDVHGDPVDPPRQRGAPVTLAEGVTLADDGATVRAEATGRIVYRDRRVGINPIMQVDCAVQSGPGPIEAPADLLLRGPVKAGCKVCAKGSVILLGAMEGGQIEAGEDVIAHAGIQGGSKAKVVAGRDLVTKFCEEAVLQVGGDLYLGTRATDSRIYVRGALYAGEAALVGGKARAGRSIEVHTLGAQGGIATAVLLAPPWNVVQAAKQIEEKIAAWREEAAEIRQALEPLMADVKTLTPEQKEQMTEQCFKADTLDADIAAAEEERAKVEQDSGDGAFIRVKAHIYPRTTVTIGSHSTTFGWKSEGPLRIEQRKNKGETELVVVHEENDSVTILKCNGPESQS